jgi:hypothetical protein
MRQRWQALQETLGEILTDLPDGTPYLVIVVEDPAGGPFLSFIR